jgi:radical SAM superfamily enzyme YgiQ (UPF0313 family)
VKGGFETALTNLRRYRIKLYITFVFGYDNDTKASFSRAVEFAKENKFYIAAFNHLTPFPGTPLYARLERENRLLYDKWWLDDRYSYNQIPFKPLQITPEELQAGCLQSRAEFYRWGSIWSRSVDAVNGSNLGMWLAFFWINYLLKQEVDLRDEYPLGDRAWMKEIIKVRERPLTIHPTYA